jgi:hypothetical protein
MCKVYLDMYERYRAARMHTKGKRNLIATHLSRDNFNYDNICRQMGIDKCTTQLKCNMEEKFTFC